MSNYHRSTSWANRERRYKQRKAYKAQRNETLGWLACFAIVGFFYILVTAAY